jgi:hypothetical protein
MFAFLHGPIHLLIEISPEILHGGNYTRLHLFVFSYVHDCETSRLSLANTEASNPLRSSRRLIRYAHVSTDGQVHDMQTDELRFTGCDHISQEHVSGSLTRPHAVLTRWRLVYQLPRATSLTAGCVRKTNAIGHCTAHDELGVISSTLGKYVR